MKTKKIAILLLVACAIAVPAYAQTVDDIMNRAMNAMGGKAKLMAMDSMVLEMTGSMMGGEMSITMTRKAPDKLRSDVHVMGMDITQATDGTDYWMSQMGTVQDMDENSKKQFEQSYAQMTGGSLEALKAQGAKLAYAGKETMDGVPADVVSLEMEGGITGKMYFSSVDGLPFRMDMTTPMGEVNTLISDYRDVEGVKMAHKIEMMMGGAPMMTMSISKIEINKPVDMSIFKRP